MTDSVKFALPYIAVGQSQKEVTHNEAIARIDILLTRVVTSVLTTPPGSPSDGAVHLVAHSATSGVFVGHEDEIAFWLTDIGAWQYIEPPVAGFEITDVTTQTRYRWTGTTWFPLNGTYTPTPVHVTNISSSTAYATMYSCAGNICTVSGKLRYYASTSGAAQIDLDLPIASNLAAEQDLVGVAVSEDVVDGPIYIKADATNNRASIYSVTDDTTTHDHFFSFQYIIK